MIETEGNYHVQRMDAALFRIILPMATARTIQGKPPYFIVCGH